MGSPCRVTRAVCLESATSATTPLVLRCRSRILIVLIGRPRLPGERMSDKYTYILRWTSAWWADSSADRQLHYEAEVIGAASVAPSHRRRDQTSVCVCLPG